MPIPGTRDSQHMRDNAEAAHIRLDQSTINTLNALINESVVTGTRYTPERMAEADRERDVVAAKAGS